MTSTHNYSDSTQQAQVLSGVQSEQNGIKESTLTMKTLEAVVGKGAFEHRSPEESSASSGGQASGSGGGYSADYSSSESSSDASQQRKGLHNLVHKISGLGVLRRSLQHSADQDNVSKSNGDGAATMDSSGSQIHQSTTVDSLAEALHKSMRRESRMANAASASPAAYRGQMPQWNGIRIEHPMDPRIDISTVQHIMKGSDPGLPLPILPNADENKDTNNVVTFPAPSADHYMSLLEAVRPFFSVSGLQMTTPEAEHHKTGQQREGSGSELSSEGFTSFFTTTNSNTGSSDSASASNSQPSASNREHAAEVSASAYQNDTSMNTDTSHQSAVAKEESDASSMVVLARVKRKHVKRKAHHGASSSSAYSDRGSEQSMPQQADGPGPPEAPEAPGPPDPQVDEVQLMAPPMRRHQESSTTSQSSSEDQAINVDLQAPIRAIGDGIHHHPMPPRVVTESSERTGSSSTGNNLTTSTSGSGSGSGGQSASANGSSGSGNDGKGSSTDNGNNENSGGDANSNSDENKEEQASSVQVPVQERRALQVDTSATGQDVASRTSQAQLPAVSFNASMPAPETTDEQNAVREQKLIDKKRKRMNMRREYEAEVKKQMASSESSESSAEVALRPGKPVTLDNVLSFAKAARLLVQAMHPFLVVHANAAYSGLSGINCHSVIGKPISSLLSIPGPGMPRELKASSDQNGVDTTPTEATSAPASLPTDADSYRGMSLERLVSASGFGRHHIVHVTAMPQHPIVGRNVTVVHKVSASPEKYTATSHDDLRSQGTGPYDKDRLMASISCRMTVSPVVSSLSTVDYAVVTDQGGHIHHHHGKHHHPPKKADDQLDSTRDNPKRRKHENSFLSDPHSLMLMFQDSHHRRNHHVSPTHFVIQLEPENNPLGHESLSSASATSMEAKHCGISKTEMKRRRIATAGVDQMEDIESSAPADTDATIAPSAQEQQDLVLRPNNMEDIESDAAASDDSDSKKPVVACG